MVVQNCQESFTSRFNIVLSGTAASAASKYICTANLIALEKSSDTIRPNALGELIRRIVSKCACSSELSDASKRVLHQVAVGVPAACESVIHNVPDLINANDHRDDMAMLKADFTNAITLVDRQSFITRLKLIFPAYTTGWCIVFCSESFLDYYGFTIQNFFCGVQKGDSFGPLLLALTLNTLVAKIKASCSLADSQLRVIKS